MTTVENISGQFPMVAVIVLSWNRREEVLKTVGILMKDDYPNIEVIVVDNASTDGTREAVLSQYPDTHVFSLPYNVGISGWDFGIMNTGAEYVVCLDDDSNPDPGAISKMLKLFESNSAIGIVPFNIYGGIFSTGEWETTANNIVGFINCGVGFRRQAVIEAGLNDPDFFLYSNEWDLSIRTLNKGYEIAFDPSIKAHHRTSLIHRSNKRLRTMTARNETWIVLKYFSLLKIPVMVCRVLLWNAMAFYLRKEGASAFRHSIQGVAVALWRWRVAWRKRERIKPEILLEYERNFWSFKPVMFLLKRSLIRMKTQVLGSI